MKRFMRTLVAPATCCMLLPARRPIHLFQQEYALVTTTRPSRMPFMWQQARNVSSKAKHRTATDGVIADQIAQVDGWCNAFPWLLKCDPDLTLEKVQDLLSSDENTAPNITVSEDEADRLHDFLTNPRMDQRLKDPAAVKKTIFRRFQDIFAKHFDHKPTNFESYLQEKRSDGQTLWFTRGPNGGHICGSNTNEDDHHISSVVWRLQNAFKMRSFIHVDDHELNPEAARVLVVSGESGSGKTHAALTSNKDGVTIYLEFSRDVSLDADERADESLTLDNSRTGLPHLSDDKRMACVNAIVERCVAALPRHRDLDYLRGVPLHIVLDELGNQPNRLRVAISHREKIVNALVAQNYGWDADKIKIMCVGTGVAHSETLISSKQGSFDIQTIGPSSLNRSKKMDINVLTTMFGIIRSSQRRLEQEAVAAFSQHPYIAPLLDNYRAAAILTSHVVHVFDNLHDDGPQMVALMSTVEYALCYVSQQFKSLNALGRLSIDKVMHHCGLGLRKALCGPTLADYAESRLKNNSTGRHIEEAKLVCDYGILTERVEDLMKVERYIRELRITNVVQLKSEAATVPDLVRLLKLPRYCMSRAVGNMMLSNFGESSLPVSAERCRGQEFTVAAKLVLLMRCFCSMEEVKRHLMANVCKAAALCHTGTAVLAVEQDRPAALDGVVLQHPHQFCDKDTEDETLRAVQISISKRKAVVLVQGGDVILVAKGLVCLVHCRQTGDNGVDVEGTSKMTVEAPQDEEFTERLCRVAGIQQEEILIVTAPSDEKLSPHEDLLFPLVWSTSWSMTSSHIWEPRRFSWC